ncbi:MULTISPECIES: hypothetical protein [Enterobacter cloacae complex]|uniref:hypothetical protein n=1 Tax=Enterobacter cloacae complex TaxID=354276 RepID=UPI0005EC300C|nr:MULTISPECIES: hypothetical protein [Enterobacter cloacae complex]HCJ7431666.1 hypothetical protein [Citrobacter freundii]HDR2513809.1 hypothetical protein [Enterobacter ludwigii]ELE9699163.1 hypothetical protein [Enterobacter kobei]ELF1031678.1 hypothetical protein [Enterobacter kobei]ELI0575509.1 hypothetical protein [Enterobacter kobei]
MSKIDKQALRSTSDRDWFEDWFKREFHPDKTGPYIKDQLFFAVRAARATLLDELEVADALNKHLELAIRKAEGCSEKLREKAEAAEMRIAELGELLKKSDVEKKQPQNTLSDRPVYLGDGSDAKEKVIAGKRDIHRYESFITDRAGKGD